MLSQDFPNSFPLILKQSVRLSKAISGDEKRVSNATKNKASDASKIIDTQIAILAKSNDKVQEILLGKSFCNSFKEVTEDNEFIGYKLSKKKQKT